jgi:hypothetical protein
LADVHLKKSLIPNLPDDHLFSVSWQIARQPKLAPSTGHALTYLFVLARQHDNDFDNCWMTDSVVPIEEGRSPPDEATTI